MPKRQDIQSVLVVGAGPIVIGQACEFDYSGTQACRVLKEDGYTVILVNSNPATIMTDPSTADRIYIEPIVPEVVEKIIAKERPDAILSTVGGQTALNCSMALYESGVLDKYGVKMIGANPKAITKAENRQQFNDAMANIGLEVPKNKVVHSLEEALAVFPEIGLPAIIRPSFTLGGSGGGIATTEDEFRQIVQEGLAASPTNEVLIDESILGWKEYEMEVIRDKNDNAIIVCSIENIDPMGVHTGDSITVAPALTLTDKEYQTMRNASLAVLREIGVETGGSNVQFAVNPKDGRLVVIEMNPRVSRSSALASKATGYPIAKIAAKLAVGYTLDEIMNDMTKVTPASFEPMIDYVVIKIPRFTFEKFPKSTQKLSSQMKSVGEAMAIGRSFAESLQKGLRSLEVGLTGLNAPKIAGLSSKNDLQTNQDIMRDALKPLSPDRLLRIAHALRLGLSAQEVHDLTHVDPWFIDQIAGLVAREEKLKKNGMPSTAPDMMEYKKLGFSDARMAELIGCSESEVTAKRRSFGIHPVFKKVDTCAGEFESQSSYLYSCYEGNGLTQATCEAQPTTRKKVVILGGGPNRIGQGIEFDYACVHAAFSLEEEDIETIMVNCNPETVSTDYDTSDKLYFEPLYHEDVIELIRREQEAGQLLGVMVQYGGQTPLKLTRFLEKEGIPVIGTSPDKIDLAEDRERFKNLLDTLQLTQPKNSICHGTEKLEATIDEMAYPVVIRPSNVLGGRAMEILHNKGDLTRYLELNGSFILDGPILVDRFLDNAVEVDVDAISDGEDVFVAGIMEHIEPAGIHSGDSACVIPSISLTEAQLEEIKTSTIKLARALEVVGLMNVQYAYWRGQLFILEVNPRASRTVPFVAKATGNSIAKIAAKVMVGRKLKEFKLNSPTPAHYSVKEVIFPFARFDQIDTLLGPEMKSTGEAMGMDHSFGLAFYKAQQAVGNTIPTKGTILVSVEDQDKPAILKAVNVFYDHGHTIYATRGTAKYLQENNINAQVVNKEKEGGGHLVDMIREGQINLVMNTSSGADRADSFTLRRSALMKRVPYATTVAAAHAMAEARRELGAKDAPDIYRFS